MSRHERDVVSLMMGVLLVLLAGLFLVTDLVSLDVDGRWVLPVLLLVVGVAGLLSTTRSRARRGAVTSTPVTPEPIDDGA